MPTQNQNPAARPHPNLTPKQLAERLQVSLDYVYRDLLGPPDGIPYIRLGHKARGPIRIRLRDVERYEDDHLQ